MKRWLYTSRAGFERDLAEELRNGRVLAPALAMSDPPRPADGADLRAPGFSDRARSRRGLRRGLVAGAATRRGRAFALHVWVPDSDAGN